MLVLPVGCDPESATVVPDVARNFGDMAERIRPRPGSAAPWWGILPRIDATDRRMGYMETWIVEL